MLALCLLLSACPIVGATSASGSQPVNWTQVANEEITATLPVTNQIADQDGLTQTFGQYHAQYTDTDIVRIIIKLEGNSVLEQGFSSASLSDNEAAIAKMDDLRAAQADMIPVISQALGTPVTLEASMTLTVNAMAISVPYGTVEQIAALPGVESVYLDIPYDVPETQPSDEIMTATASSMVGASSAWALGYTGAGSRIAVIDTGICHYNRSFDSAALMQHLKELYRQETGADASSDDEIRSYFQLLTAQEIDRVLPRLNASALARDLSGESLHQNDKIAFAFNYQDRNLVTHHDSDTQGSHGSHVSGIAAANYYVPTSDGGFALASDTVHTVGVAPDAQIITMKVFGATGGAYASVYTQAIEDALLLGCDSVNLSLGSASAGFATAGDEYIDGVFRTLDQSDTVVTISAGNASTFSTYFTGSVKLIQTQDVNLGRVGSPGSYGNAFTVASMDNSGQTGAFSCFTGSNGSNPVWVLPNDRGASYGLKDWITLDTTGEGVDYPIVFLGDPSALLSGSHSGSDPANYYGSEADFKDLDLTGKIVLVARGAGINFADKYNRGIKAGAASVIVYNNADGDLNMDLTGASYSQPCVSITLAEAKAIFALAQKTNGQYTAKVHVSSRVTSIPGDVSTYTLSSFSSWGTSGALTIKPEITTPGGSIYSVGNGETAYETMSGTSMAAPNMAGQAAILQEYLQETFSRTADGTVGSSGLTYRGLAQALSMSTAMPIMDSEAGQPYPVRAQGAGMANVANAIDARAILYTGSDDGKVKVELGDDPTQGGLYTIPFQIRNLTARPLRYSLSADVLAPMVEQIDGIAYLSQHDTALAAQVDFQAEGLDTSCPYVYDLNGDGAVNEQDVQDLLDTINGKGSVPAAKLDLVDFNCTGAADEADAYQFLALLAGTDTSRNILERYGATVQVQPYAALDVTVTIQLSPAALSYIQENFPNGTYVEGYVYAQAEEGADLSLPYLGFCGDWSNPSMFDHAFYLEDYYTGRTTGSYMGLSNYIGYSYAESPASVSYFVGNQYAKEDTYRPERNAFSSLSGDALAEIAFTVIRDTGALSLAIENTETGERYFEVTPSTWPAPYYQTSSGTWQNTQVGGTMNWKGTDYNGDPLPEGTSVNLWVRAEPEYCVGQNAQGKGLVWQTPFVIDNTEPVIQDVTYSFLTNTLTVQGQDNRYVAAAYLYNGKGSLLLDKKAANQETLGESITLDFDLSQVDSNGLYIQLIDYAGNTTSVKIDLKVGNPGDTYAPLLYGFDTAGRYWFSTEPNTTATSLYTDTQHQFYAAEFVGGHVFAATTSQLYVMPFGQWDSPRAIANLPQGATFIDMAYDRTSDTLYALGGDNTVYTIDQQTGIATLAGSLALPDGVVLMTLASDSAGTFYSTSHSTTGNSMLYRFTITGAGSLSTPKAIGSTGLSCVYVQSMSWDSTDGTLYWAQSDATGSKLCTLNPNSGTAAICSQLSGETTGLMIPNDDLITYPAAQQVEGVAMSLASTSLLVGGSTQLLAMVQPWTAADTSVSWSTSSADVVSVDAAGVITAKSAGTAVVMAASNQNPALVASCIVTVYTAEFNAVGESNGKDYWVSFDSTSLDVPQKLRSSPIDVCGSVYAGNGVYYAHNEQAMFRVDAKENYSCVQVSAINANNFGDAAYSPTFHQLVMPMGAYYLVFADCETWKNPFMQLMLDSSLTSAAYWYTETQDGITYDVFLIGTARGGLYRMRYDGTRATLVMMGYAGTPIKDTTQLVKLYYADLWVDYDTSYAYWSYLDEATGQQKLMAINLLNGQTVHMGDMGITNVTGLSQQKYDGTTYPTPSASAEQPDAYTSVNNEVATAVLCQDSISSTALQGKSPARKPFSTIQASVSTEQGELAYLLDADAKTATVTGYSANADTSATRLVIPATISYGGDTYTVTAIGDAAFKNNAILTEIQFPDTLVTIGKQAFMGASALTEIILPDSVTLVDDEAFSFYKSFTADQPNVVTKLKLPAKLERAGIKSFAGLSNVKDLLVLPATLTTLDEYCFFRLGQTGEFVLPSTVTTVGRYAFDHNDNLTKVTINAASATYGNNCFGQCIGLKEVSIVEGITTLPSAMFVACTALEKITLPDSLQTVGSNFLQTCEKLTTVNIPKSMTATGSGMFWNCKALSSIAIPETLTTIGPSTFYNCTSITEFTIGRQITSIGNNAFYGSGLKEILIPNTVTSLGTGVFESCASLSKAVMEEGIAITELPNSLFDSCSKLASFEIPATVTRIGTETFYRCTALKSLNLAEIPLTTIDRGAFQYCGLEELTIPATVTAVPGYAFAYMQSLKSVRILCNITEFGSNYGIFTNCTKLEHVEFSDRFETFGDRMFQGCSSLRSITVPVNASKLINGNPFGNCINLTEILVAPGNTAFQSIDGVLYTADGKTLVAYPNAKEGNLVIPQGVERIASFAFYYHAAESQGVVFPDSLTTIGSYAFAYASKLTGDITLPDSVNLLETTDKTGDPTKGYGYTFTSTGITSLTLPKHMRVVPAYLANNCKSLSLVRLPLDMEVLGSSAFNGDSALETISIPGNLSTLNNSIFNSCTNLKHIYFEGTVPSLLFSTASLPNTAAISTTVHYPAKFAAEWQAKIEEFNSTGKYKYVAWESYEPEAYAVSISTPAMTLIERESAALTAAVHATGSRNTDLTWQSGDSSIVSVDSTGKLTANKAGVTTITASAGNFQDSVEITVIPYVPVTQVTLSQEAATLDRGQTLTLTAAVLPENASYPEVTWRSSNPAVATVDASGVVTAQAAGSCLITAEADGICATCAITVNRVPVTGVSLSDSEITMAMRETARLIATVLPAQATDSTVLWSSSDESVVTVNFGVLTAKSTGTATITAVTRDGGFSATCAVTVTPVAPVRVTVEPVELSMYVGDTSTLQASILPADAADLSLTWRSSDTGIATVDSTGTVTAIAPGEAAITVSTWNGKTSTCFVNVTKRPTPIDSVTLEEHELDLNIGQTHRMSVTVLPETAENRAVIWTSSDESVVEVSSGGVLTARKEGAATITVTSVISQRTDSCVVRVSSVPVQGIRLQKNQLTLAAGSIETLQATVLPENATNPVLTWVSSDESVAKVSDTGTVTALREGTAVITVSCAGFSDSCTVTVTPVRASVRGIYVAKTALTLTQGRSVTLEAYTLPYDAANPTLLWETSDAQIVTVTDGVLTAKAPGAAQITVTTQEGGYHKTVHVTVTAPSAEITLSAAGQDKHITAVVKAAQPMHYGTVLLSHTEGLTRTALQSDISLSSFNAETGSFLFVSLRELAAGDTLLQTEYDASNYGSYTIQANTQRVTVNLEDVTAPFAFTRQPESYQGKVEDLVTFTVSTNRSNVSYQWQYSNNQGQTWSDSAMPGCTTDTLQVPLARFRSGQMYRCVATDAQGTVIVSQTASMEIQSGHMEIVRQPVSVQGKSGETVQFTVEAVGDGLRYQWEYSNTQGQTWGATGAQGGQTPTMTTQLQSYRNGQMYRCRITDAYGNLLYTQVVQMTILP